jgi:hypothetical protein
MKYVEAIKTAMITIEVPRTIWDFTLLNILWD